MHQSSVELKTNESNQLGIRKISIVLPIYNEEHNIILMHQKLNKIIDKKVPEYDYEIIFIND